MSLGPLELMQNGEIDLCSVERRLALMLSSERMKVSSVCGEGRTMIVQWWLGVPSNLVDCRIEFERPIPPEGRSLCFQLWEELDMLANGNDETWTVTEVFLHRKKRPKQYTIVFERNPKRPMSYYSSSSGA